MNKALNQTAVLAADQSSRPASFARALERHQLAPLVRAPLATVQVNLGRLCNQACNHCHVDAGPKRREIMTTETMNRIVKWLEANEIEDIDITGGAPEMNPGFRVFVDRCLAFGARVRVRCNLTILLEPGYTDLPEWYAARRVLLTCSLPCYSEDNVDGQRGKGVFQRSIEALRTLNSAGYGTDPALELDLVYNPAGAFLPPPQQALERNYKRELGERYGVVFNRLLALANLPINRFAHYLELNGQLDSYRRTLSNAFNPDTVPALMCRHLVSVDWLGNVYDCDFNQMLDLPAPDRAGRRKLWEFRREEFEGRAVATGPHCFGCTAGAGSSCGGSLA
ncbi:MAG: arsenosugar biosynthesis radical SAM protein ArsS [Gammaproteobacteria bacterium]|nr:arsenosugar biosynthesis radical SAM protein ArsS [Gammaproteobacteria bacterium]